MTGRDPLPAMPAPDPSVPHVVAPAVRVSGSGAYVRVCSCEAKAWGWTRAEADMAAGPHLVAGRERGGTAAEPAGAVRAGASVGERTRNGAGGGSGPHWVVELVALAADLVESTDAPRAARVLERVPAHVWEEADAWRRGGGAG